MTQETKHTPGPWEVEGQVITANQFDICELYGGAQDCDENVISREMLSANANLIAAAPDMLAALEAIAAMPDPETGDRGPIRYARHIAKAAIAKTKAKGE